MKKFALSFLLLPTVTIAVVNDTDQKLHNVAKPTAPLTQPKVEMPKAEKEVIDVTIEQLAQNPQLTQQLLNDALFARQALAIDTLLNIYRTFPNKDKTLVLFAEGLLAELNGNISQAIRLYREILATQPELNVVRIELAKALFNDQQNSAAEDQFNKAKTAENLPPPVAQLIDAYLNALKKRNGWQFNASAYYLNDDNVNSVSSSPEIENTGYVKNENMLPQKAHGFAYNAGISRDFSLIHSHYLTLQNDFYGKSYWDSHENDEITNRTLVGYSYKTEKSTLRLLPFFEKRWYSGSSYRKTQGVRAEFNHWLSTNWQISTALEYGKQRYYYSTSQDGNNKLISGTLLWLPNPQQYFYIGSDIIFERTQIRQFSSDTKSLRLGWGQEWQTWGISSNLNLSIMDRTYQDTAKLGGLLNLGKVRSDNVYTASLTLWKRDWHLLGITPKLQFSWQQHDSNIPSLYSYIDKTINLIFETRF